MASEIVRLWMPDPLDGLDPQADEALPPATRDEALVRAASIREGIERFARETVPQVATAYLARDWAALGYPSWEAYVRGEFGQALLRLSRPERREAVGTLRMFGMSTRAIAGSLGVDAKTVRNDLAAAESPGGEKSPPAPVEVVGADGKQYPAARPGRLVHDSSSGSVKGAAGGLPAATVAPVPAQQPPAAAAAGVVDEGVELVAGRVRIRVRAQRRADGVPAVFVRLTSTDRTIGEEWIEADGNDDPLQLGAALSERDLDALIGALIDARSALRAGVV